MTLIISMCTKSGIYLIADRKLTKHSDIYENAGEIQKIIKLNNKVVLSFWGSYELKGNKNVTDLISDFKRKISNGEGIEIISEKLKNFLENQNSPFLLLVFPVPVRRVEAAIPRGGNLQR